MVDLIEILMRQNEKFIVSLIKYANAFKLPQIGDTESIRKISQKLKTQTNKTEHRKFTNKTLSLSVVLCCVLFSFLPDRNRGWHF